VGDEIGSPDETQDVPEASVQGEAVEPAVAESSALEDE